ncbi:hypothetical protein [Bacillus cereus]|uniref:Uncharacterized protein n=1 Tax=Bacillus cereus HuA3-9 TaxID=1053205 RepID=R8CIX8_BACCE|nr:hypothetical protein [Bacillus cereus]EOO11470.1 hypothetical protein IGA_05746 [Bacillus cereus HuA3-9]
MNAIVKLGIDLYHNRVSNYTATEAQEVLRKEMLEKIGCEDGKFSYKKFRKNKNDLFELIEETLEVLVSEGLEEQFSGFAEIRNLKMGDTNVFKVPSNHMFKISTTADGHGNHRRQRLIDDSEFTVTPVTYQVKVYEELHRFLAGRVDWSELVNAISKSFVVKLRNDVYEAVYNSYDQLKAPYQRSGNFELDTLTDIVSHVETATDSEAIVLGTKKALSKIAPALLSDRMKDEFNATGFFGRIAGIELREIPQSHKIGTHEFAIDDNFLMVVPTSIDKFVKIVNEGEAIIMETEAGKNADQTAEYDFIMKQGISVMSSTHYGIYRLA